MAHIPVILQIEDKIAELATVHFDAQQKSDESDNSEEIASHEYGTSYYETDQENILAEGYFSGIPLAPGECLDWCLASMCAREIDLSGPTAWEEIEQIVLDGDSEPEARRIAASALIRRWKDNSPYHDRIIDFMRDKDPQIRIAAIVHIARIWRTDVPKFIDAMFEVVEDNYDRLELFHLAKALSKFPGEAIEPVLQRLELIPDKDINEYVGFSRESIAFRKERRANSS